MVASRKSRTWPHHVTGVDDDVVDSYRGSLISPTSVLNTIINIVVSHWSITALKKQR